MEENFETKNGLTTNYNFTKADFNQIEALGINLQKIEQELSLYKLGISKIIIEKPATINDGIVSLLDNQIEKFIRLFEEQKENYSLEKFVPASGAASRMFAFLSEFLIDFKPEKESINAYINRKNDTSLSAFIIGMDKFPFFKTVYNRLKEKYADFDSWKRDNKNYRFIKILLDEKEFNFANKPKGIIPFHDYSGTVVTPVEEHLKEANLYSETKNSGKVHFTISNEHQLLFEQLVKESNNQNVEVRYSEQVKTTDTIAVDCFNNPLRDKNNKLVFRPGGHGALIHNLNNLKTDIVFIKNIDNVSYNHIDSITSYKKLLAGYLIELQNNVFEQLKVLNQIELKKEAVETVKVFIKHTLNIELAPDFDNYKKESQISHLESILNRPIRVCGMVKNENEPGGGPFWIREKTGAISLQIVEKSQIDSHNKAQLQLFQSATHFNPVDLVCGLKNYKGTYFNLLDFIDQNSGFIVEKSKGGIQYKAYELPGLWNGAMANWITIFIEVPLETFNPVKTVNDLLKHNHQQH